MKGKLFVTGTAMFLTDLLLSKTQGLNYLSLLLWKYAESDHKFEIKISKCFYYKAFTGFSLGISINNQ